MKRSTDRILTTHIGSLARKPELLQLLVERSEGKAVDPKRFEPMVREAVADVVKRQVEAGVTVVNDGEQSKIGHASYLKDRLSGFEVEKEVVLGRTFASEADDFPEYYSRPSTLANEKFRRAARRAYCAGPIAWQDFSEVERDIRNLKDAVKGLPVEDIFMTAPSPSIAASSQANRYYKTPEEYLYAMADVLKREYKAIVDAGFVLQVDCIGMGAGSRGASGSDDIEQQRRHVAHNIEVLNYALADVPAEKVRMHMCWGSDPGPHHRDGDLKNIADLIVAAKPAGITLVCASGRHSHEWKVWEDVKLPEGKVLIVGVIDHTSNVVEHPETVSDRIQRWASVVGRENVIAGVDCGFDPSAGIEELRVDRRIVWAKLRSLAQGAELASRELWRK